MYFWTTYFVSYMKGDCTRAKISWRWFSKKIPRPLDCAPGFTIQTFLAPSMASWGQCCSILFSAPALSDTRVWNTVTKKKKKKKKKIVWIFFFIVKKKKNSFVWIFFFLDVRKLGKNKKKILEDEYYWWPSKFFRCYEKMLLLLKILWVWY